MKGARSGGAYGVRCCSKEFVQLLLDAGYSHGTKTYDVEVPRCVLEGSGAVKAAFLRGLFATDGCVYLAAPNKDEIHWYPHIGLCSASERLVLQAKRVLDSLGISCHVWSYRRTASPEHRLRVAGVERARFFEEIVGFSNPKHAARIELAFFRSNIFKREQ